MIDQVIYVIMEICLSKNVKKISLIPFILFFSCHNLAISSTSLEDVMDGKYTIIDLTI